MKIGKKIWYVGVRSDEVSTYLDLARVQRVQPTLTSISYGEGLVKASPLILDCVIDGHSSRGRADKKRGLCRKEMASSSKLLRIASLPISASTATGLLL
jgi:hypothetical protein